MKNTYTTLILLFALTMNAQSIRITGLVEGDCPTGSTAPRVIELYIDGTLNLSGLQLQQQIGANTNWTAPINLGSFTYTDEFIYVFNDQTAFNNNFSALNPPAQNTNLGTIVLSNGSKVRLVDTNNENEVIDIYGIDGVNGDGKSWEIENSYAKRINGFGPNPIFTESEWEIAPVDDLIFDGACWSEPELNNIVELGVYNTLSTIEVEEAIVQPKLFPNPVSIGMSIKIQSKFDFNVVQVYSLDGKKVTNIEVKNSEFSTSGLKSGLYIIRLDDKIERRSFTQKLIVK